MSQASQIAPSARSLAPDGVRGRIAATAAGEIGAHRRNVARNAMIVSAAFIASRILGLMREMVLAQRFGTTGIYDAYVSAFRIPDLLFLVIMAGSFGAAFIPVFGGYLAQNDQRRAWHLASAVLTWAGVGIAVAAVVCFILARPLMTWVVAPGLAPENQDAAVKLMRILLLSPAFLGFGIAAKGILEAHHRFTLPALAPVLYNICIILGALYLAPVYGIYGVAWSVIAGAALHLGVQIPGLIMAGIRFKPTLDRNVAGLREVGRLLLPRVIGQAAFQINFIAVNYFASRSGHEEVSALNYAWQLMMLPHGVLALSISTVIFPTLSQLYARGRTDEMRETVSENLRPLLFLTIPASLGLLFLRDPIVTVAFQRGAFDSHSTHLVVDPLVFFAIGLTAYGLVEILTRVYYATRDTRTPVITGVLIIGLNIIFCKLFVGQLRQTGLALALSATTAAEAIILLLFLRQRLDGLFDAAFRRWLARLLLANASFGALLWAFSGIAAKATRAAHDQNQILAGVFLLYTIGVFIVAYVVIARLARIPELQMMTGKIGRRLPGPLYRLLAWLEFV